MFFVRKRLRGTIVALVMAGIPLGVFLLLVLHIQVWAAAVAAGAVFAASLWSGL